MSCTSGAMCIKACFLMCEWRVFIELLKTYSNMKKYPLKPASHKNLKLNLVTFGVQLHFLPVSPQTGELDKTFQSPSCPPSLSLSLFLSFWEKKHRFFLYFIRGRYPMLLVTLIFCTPSSSWQTQCHVVVFQWQAANVFSVIKLAPGAKRAWGNHQELIFTLET